MRNTTISDVMVSKLREKELSFERGCSIREEWSGFDPRSGRTVVEKKSIQRSIVLEYCRIASEYLVMDGARALEIGVEKHRNVCLSLGLKEWERLDRLDDVGGNKTDYFFDYVDEEIPSKLIEVFDVVVCSSVLEHTFEVVKGFERTFSLARQGGIVYISTPFGIGVHGSPDYWRMTPQVYERLIPNYSSRYVILREVYGGVLHGVSCFAIKG